MKATLTKGGAKAQEGLSLSLKEDRSLFRSLLSLVQYDVE